MLLSGLVNSNPELKSFCFDCDTTVENMSSYFARLLADNENLRLAGVDSIVVRLFESEGSYAESKINIE